MLFLRGELDDMQSIFLTGFHRVSAFFKEILASALYAVQENPAYRTHDFVATELVSSMKDSDVHAHSVSVDNHIVAIVKQGGNLVGRNVKECAVLDYCGIFSFQFLPDSAFNGIDGGSLGVDAVKDAGILGKVKSPT